jgi:8-oxo-dGTP pyrophosphatase MutT (NUDIX family)
VVVAAADRTDACREPQSLDARSLNARLGRHEPTVLPAGVADRRAAVTLLLTPAPETAGAAARGEADIVEALFVLRAEVDGDPWSGHVALPGGREEEADADLLDTARRELREEAAIDLPRDAYAGRLDDLHPRSAHLPSIVVSPFVAWLGERPELSENYELAGHLWIPLAELVAPGRRAQLERPGSPPRVFETIEYAGATVWGMTLAIVDDFLRRIGLA